MTDRQGHVNNAVFSTMLETGRVEMLLNPDRPLAAPGCSFVIAGLTLDFLSEVTWPGSVDIGTRVQKVGRSSLTLAQGIFQNETCAATAQTVVVQIDDKEKRSRPLSAETVKYLENSVPPPDDTAHAGMKKWVNW